MDEAHDAPAETHAVVARDRDLPKIYVGQLEPNYFCRAWNPKPGRQKYCGARAGWGTTHAGAGRCKQHGGTTNGDRRMRSGRYSKVKRQRLGALIAEFATDPDPLNLGDELALQRALLAEMLAKQAGDGDVQRRLLDEIGKMVERIERIRSQNAISRPELNRIMQEMWRAVDGRIQDDSVKAAIREDWLRVAL